MANRAVEGDAQAAKEISDRVEGRAPMAAEDRDAMAATGRGIDPLMALYRLEH